MRRAQELSLLEQLDALEVSDEERAAILVMALVRRSRALRTRAVSLVGGRVRGRAEALRRAARAALALAEAEEAMSVAGTWLMRHGAALRA